MQWPVKGLKPKTLESYKKFDLTDVALTVTKLSLAFENAELNFASPDLLCVF